MSKLNISINLNTYSDKRSSNAPSMTNFKWNRTINGIDAQNAQSQQFTIAPNTTVTLFTGSAVKKFTYLETDLEISMAINAADPESLKPVVINSSVFPGVFMRTSDITSIEVTNSSTTESATIFLATVE